MAATLTLQRLCDKERSPLKKPQLEELLLGSRSVLARTLDKANEYPDGFSGLAGLLRELLRGDGDQSLEKIVARLRPAGSAHEIVRHREHATHLIEPLAICLEMAEQIKGNTEVDPTSFQSALDGFDRWYSSEIIGERNANHDEVTVNRKLLPRNCKSSSMAYGTVCDLLRRWFGELPDFKSAETVILAAPETDAGILMKLTVELSDRPGGQAGLPGALGALCPDPLCLGLTDISGLMGPMQEVWNSSGLGDRYQGRWRIEDHAKYPGGSRQVSISGPSAQAATMVALLAASGNPYLEGMPDDAPAQLIDPKVAITAELEPGSSGGSPTELKLKEVDRVPQKMQGAAGKLDVIAFTEEDYERARQDENSDLAKIEKEREKPAKDRDWFGHLRFERLKTVLEALDLMLLTNRHLREYQKAVSVKWLSQWEEGAAEALTSRNSSADES